MLLLIERIGNEGGAYGSAPEDSRERFANKTADDEGAGHIEDFPEACARSEEP